LSALHWNSGAFLLLGAKVGILVHHIDERPLDQVGEFERATVRAITLRALLNLAGNLDAQEGAFIQGFEFENRHRAHSKWN